MHAHAFVKGASGCIFGGLGRALELALVEQLQLTCTARLGGTKDFGLVLSCGSSELTDKETSGVRSLCTRSPSTAPSLVCVFLKCC